MGHLSHTTRPTGLSDLYNFLLSFIFYFKKDSVLSQKSKANW